MKVLLSTAYWPNLHYFYYILNSERITIESYENYQKQSYRNRTQILTANGKLDLSIPIKKINIKELIKDVEISYNENWQINHWRALTSAYKNSPYFEFFEEEINYFYTKEFKFLMDYNSEQLKLVLKLLKLKKDLSFTTVFEKEPADCLDFRNNIHPKIEFTKDTVVASKLTSPYYQTFESKFSFEPNLSILDLLFNKGLETVEYLSLIPSPSPKEKGA
ncbi:MAG: WbqC family protein [Bacteroidetes bacterium]|nr:WbqC family protein [Bacteroidota bacterium]